MEKWRDKVVVVTGASAGIGAQVCRDLYAAGLIVVGLARRLDRLLELQRALELTTAAGGQFHAVRCDLLQDSDIGRAFDEIIATHSGIDVLVNNAGTSAHLSVLDDDNADAFRDIVQTNLLAVVACTKRAYRSMVARDTCGYIVNVSSVLGHVVPQIKMSRPMFGIYPSSKYALNALNHVIRSELAFHGRHKVRVSNISPGKVDTEIMASAGITDDDWYTPCPKALQPEDVSQAICYMLSTPEHVLIQDIIMKPVGDGF